MATSDLESSDIVAAALSMQKELRERAPELERARRLPADLSQRFAAAGLYRSCVPEVYGGLELSPLATVNMIEVLAQADASAAWCAFIGATSGSVLALVPPDTARELFFSPEVLFTGVFAPRGRAEHTADGFRATGRWQWGSNSENADWVMGGCQLLRDGEPERDARGAPRAHMLLVPAADVEFLDTWHVSGLCGTGSTDFAFHDLLVPESRAVGYKVEKPLERPLYAFPHFGLLAMGIAGVALGLARAAIDELVSFAGDKRPVGSRRQLAERPGTQAEVAEAEALLRSARAFFYESLEAAFERACADGRIPLEARRNLRLATTHAVRSCARAVDKMYELGGGTSVYESSPLQRIFRDVHVATQHMMVGRPTLELAGRLFLGLESDTSQL
jgi:alkylation response protein AidB-like acyl-CoA dehydrogenase